MLRVCIASIQNVERSFFIINCFGFRTDIPLRTIKLFSVLFSSAYSSMLQAVTNKHSMVRRRLCDLHISDCGQYIANILPTNDGAFYKYYMVQVIGLFCTAAAEC